MIPYEVLLLLLLQFSFSSIKMCHNKKKAKSFYTLAYMSIQYAYV